MTNIFFIDFVLYNLPRRSEKLELFFSQVLLAHLFTVDEFYFITFWFLFYNNFLFYNLTFIHLYEACSTDHDSIYAGKLKGTAFGEFYSGQ